MVCINSLVVSKTIKAELSMGAPAHPRFEMRALGVRHRSGIPVQPWMCDRGTARYAVPSTTHGWRAARTVYRWMVGEGAVWIHSRPAPTVTVEIINDRPRRTAVNWGTGGEGRRDKPIGTLSTVTDAPQRRIVPVRAGR